MGCYIWYSEEGPGRAEAPPSPLLAVPNVTAHPSTAVHQLHIIPCGTIIITFALKRVKLIHMYTMAQKVKQFCLLAGICRKPCVISHADGSRACSTSCVQCRLFSVSTRPPMKTASYQLGYEVILLSHVHDGSKRR